MIKALTNQYFVNRIWAMVERDEYFGFAKWVVNEIPRVRFELEHMWGNGEKAMAVALAVSGSILGVGILGWACVWDMFEIPQVTIRKIDKHILKKRSK